MIRFEVGGKFLDLPEDFSLQFTKTNPLFAFDEIEAERTTEFDVPATPNNDSILGMAKDVHVAGTSMRTRVAAELQAGLVVFHGDLYVSAYNNKERTYTCVYVYGDMVDILGTTAEGNLSEYMSATELPDTATYDKTTPTSSTTPFPIHWETAQYYNRDVDGSGLRKNVYPSIGLKYLISAIASHFGMTITLPSGNRYQYMTLTPDALLNSDGDEAELNDSVRLIDNLPECTLAELLKMVAAVSGTMLNIQGKTVTYETLTSAGAQLWNAMVLDGKIIERGKMTREALNFAQDSYIKTAYERSKENGYLSLNIIDDAATEWPSEQPSLYHVDNVNLERESLIYDLAFDGGDEQAIDSRVVFSSDQSEFGIGYQNVRHDNVKSLQVSAQETGRVPVSDLVQAICSQSTRIDVKVSMTLYEYQGLTPKTRIYMDGADWVWTECAWSDGVAQMKLQKI